MVQNGGREQSDDLPMYTIAFCLPVQAAQMSVKPLGFLVVRE